jgi:hypothetical protein
LQKTAFLQTLCKIQASAKMLSFANIAPTGGFDAPPMGERLRKGGLVRISGINNSFTKGFKHLLENF